MLHRIVHIAFVILGILAPAPCLWGAGHVSATISPDQKILVLRNGQTFEGRVTQSEGQYVVDFSDGQIRIKAADVDLVCSSLEDGYRQKRTVIRVGNVHHHLELAEWCLRHGLPGPAALELADATVAEPNNPMIGALQHRLKMAMEPRPSVAVGSKATLGPSNEELDRMVRSLPRGTVETFTQSIQPVLMNHCAAGGCHGPQSGTGLRLFRLPTGKSANRRITQRNLYAVLPFVNRENPTGSRLLTVPNGPHGTVKQAIFNEHQAAQYGRLVEWASQVAQQAAPQAPATLTPASPFESFPAETPPQVLSQEARKAHRLSAHGQEKTAKQDAVSLDSEIFNRRYAPEKAKNVETTATKEPQMNTDEHR